jgi:cobalt-zinc-cadmium resistance protein CzcA
MDRLVAIAVSRRYLMVGLFVAVMIGGLIAFKQLNIEAYPDPTPPMVDIVTQSPGLSSEEIERYITIPIETQVAGIKNLRTIRTISLYGLSDVKLQFSFDYTYDEALQQVLNRLSQLAPLPGNVQPGFRRSARSAKSTATAWSARRTTACSTSRRCRTGCCSAASAPCPA